MITRRLVLSYVQAASTLIYSTAICNPRSHLTCMQREERKKLGVREWTKDPMEGGVDGIVFS